MKDVLSRHAYYQPTYYPDRPEYSEKLVLFDSLGESLKIKFRIFIESDKDVSQKLIQEINIALTKRAVEREALQFKRLML